MTLDRVLPAEDALVSGMLRDLNLSYKLTESRTVSGSVLSGDSDLFGALSHCELKNEYLKAERKIRM